MSTVIAEHDVTVLLGDVREQLATLPDGSVQCVVTSPPYFGLRDYGVDGQIGLEASPVEYVEQMRGVFADARRVLAADGVLWLNLGDTYSTRVAVRASSHQDGLNGAQYGKDWKRDRAAGLTRMPTFLPEKNLMGIPWRVAFALQDDGWILRSEVVWHKTTGLPESVADRPAKRHENVFMFSKSRRYWFDLTPIREPLIRPDDRPRPISGRNLDPRHVAATDNVGWKDHPVTGHPEGKNPGDVWSLPVEPFPGAHFATMPTELARRCIASSCPDGGTVLDPFVGSGTTLMVARSLGRKSIGIELNPDYIGIIRDRIGQTPLDFGEASA